MRLTYPLSTTSFFSISREYGPAHAFGTGAPLYPWWQCKPKQTLSSTWAARGRQDILHSECTHTWRTIKGVARAKNHDRDNDTRLYLSLFVFFRQLFIVYIIL